METGGEGPNGLAVPRRLGERTKNLLVSLGLLDTSKRVFRSEEEIVFPIRGPLLEGYVRDLPGARPVMQSFAARPRRPRSFREALEKVLSREEVALLGRSYDIVGGVAILELPDPLLGKGERIGGALLSWLPVETVAVKTSPTSGEERVRGLRVIAGRRSLETVHRENGLSFAVDLSKAFFNPRLGRERRRVADLARGSRLVIDMFAGVGPFAITIARRMDDPRGKVFAVEKNKGAFRYLLRNVAANHAENVDAILGDAAQQVPRIAREIGGADVIVMNLPKSSDRFLKAAAASLRPGGRLHYYRLLPKDRGRQWAEAELTAAGSFRIETFHRVESYSPSRSIHVVDAVSLGGRLRGG